MPLAFLFWGSLATFLFVITSFILLAIKYSPTNLNYITSIDYKYLILAFFLFFLYHTFDMLRLKVIAEGFGIKYPTSYAYITSFIATFGATVTPAHIGGELIIFYMLKRLGIKKHKIWGTILFKTISGFSFFLIALPLFILYTASNPLLLRKLIFIGLIFFIFSIISYPFFKWFQRFNKNPSIKRSLKLYCYSIIYFWKHKKLLFLKACFFSTLLYLTFLSFAPVLLKAFHIKFDIFSIYILQLPLIYAIFSSPTPGGSGVGEFGGIAIFQDIVPTSLLGLFIILWRFFSQYLGASIGGILFTYIVFKDWKKYRKKSSI